MILLLIVVAVAVYRYVTTPLETAFSTAYPSDLHVYVLGGQQVKDHLPLYAHDLLPGLPFTYPPFAGVVFSWLPTEEWFGVAWKLVSVVVLAGVVWGSSISKKHVVPLVAFFVLCTEPVQGTLYFGQVNLLLMGLVCLDFLPKNRLPGIGTGLAAGIKLTPAFFIVLLIYQRRWGATFVAAFTFVCTAASGMNVVDAPNFWTRAIFSTQRIGVDENPGAQSIRQVLARAGMDSTLLWLTLCAAVTILALLACRRAPAPLAVSFIGLTACLVSPFSWYHHWVWIVPLGVFVFERYGSVALMVLMAPYASVVLWPGAPQFLYIAVPVLFMAWYALPSGYAHPFIRRSDRGSHSTRPRPRSFRRPGPRYRRGTQPARRPGHRA